MKIPMHDLDTIKASNELKRKTLLSITQKKNKKGFLKFFLPSTVIICILLFLMYPLDKKEDNVLEIYSYISIDINPSLELQLNENDTVVNVIGFNEEAKILLQTMNITGLPAKEAISTVLGNKSTKEYINSGYLQVSVYSENQKHAKTLELSINDSLSKTLDKTKYNCSNSTKYNYEAANAHHISFGKYQVIDMIRTIDASYTIEQLQSQPMIELKNIYEQISGETLPKGHNENTRNHKKRNNHH